MKDKQSAGNVLLRAVLPGTGISLAAAGAACVLCAVLIRNGLLSEDRIRIWSAVICAAGMIPGCLAAQARADRARLPVSLACCALTLAVLAALRALPGIGGAWSWHTAVTALVCAIGCALLGAGRGR